MVRILVTNKTLRTGKKEIASYKSIQL